MRKRIERGVDMVDVEKLGLVLNLEVKRSGRRTYVNLSDIDVKTYRISPGDVVKVKLLEIRRLSEVEV